MSDEQTVPVDGLMASLEDLVKAADAVETRDALLKAESANLGQGGRGNNFASPGDAGPLDDMMIGKMTAKMAELGISGDPAAIAAFAGFAGGMFQAERPTASGGKGKMRGKAEGEDDEGDGDGGDGDGDGGDQPFGRAGAQPPIPGMRKSFQEQFRADPAIAEAVDVSPFLEAIAARNADGLDQLAKAMGRESSKNGQFQKAVAVAMFQLGSLVKSMREENVELRARLGIVERTPLPQRGVTGTAQPMNKSLPEAGGKTPTKFTKREIVNTLSYMNIVKGQRMLGQTKTSDALVKAEAGSVIAPEILAAVESFHKQNPAESEAAKAFGNF